MYQWYSYFFFHFAQKKTPREGESSVCDPQDSSLSEKSDKELILDGCVKEIHVITNVYDTPSLGGLSSKAKRGMITH